MFHFSTKGEYAVLAILALSLHSGQDPLQVKSIAKKQKISVRFLEQVMSLLKKRGLVESVRGPHGGYLLTKPPDQIQLSEVLQAIDGPLGPVELTEKRQNNQFGPNKSNHEAVILQEVRVEVNVVLKDLLDSISFANLCERKRAQEEKQVLMYHI